MKNDAWKSQKLTEDDNKKDIEITEEDVQSGIAMFGVSVRGYDSVRVSVIARLKGWPDGDYELAGKLDIKEKATKKTTKAKIKVEAEAGEGKK